MTPVVVSVAVALTKLTGRNRGIQRSGESGIAHRVGRDRRPATKFYPSPRIGAREKLQDEGATRRAVENALTVVLAAAVMMGKGCERFPAPTRSVPSPLSAKVFPPNVQHLQENIAIIVEIKKEGTKRDHPDGGSDR